MEEFKDRRLRYVELPNAFRAKASDILITSKQHLRACERLAEHLSKQRPKTPKEFEQNEWMKDFVIKSSTLNENTIELLEYIKNELQEIAKDAEILIEGAMTADIIRDQEDAIKMVTHLRDTAINNTYELKKQQIRENKATA